jgi:hypothetical protein
VEELENLEESSAVLLQDLMQLAPGLVETADKVLSPVSDSRQKLRDGLIQKGWIIPFDQTSVAKPASLCAVDGARVTDKMYAADLLVAVATSADGLFKEKTEHTPSAVWADIQPHSPDTDKIVGTAMASLEIQVIANIKHEIRLLDGSFLTPMLEFMKGLAVSNRDARNQITDIILEKNVLENLTQILSYDSLRPLIALPKSESASFYKKEFEEILGSRINVTDRIIATQILDQGEMLKPRRLSEWQNLHVQANPESTQKTKELASKLNAIISDFGSKAAQGYALTTYFKPQGSNNVLRLEFQSDTVDDYLLATKYASIISQETRAPHTLEPTAQWAVDRKAKTISVGARALKASLLNHLSDQQAKSWGRFIAENYRT